MRLTSRLLSVITALVVVLAACSSRPSATHATAASQDAPATPAPLRKADGTPTPTASASSSSDLSAKLSEIEGQVLARASQSASFNQASPGYVLQVLGQTQTESDGKVRLDFSTGTLMRLGPNTLFTLQPTQENSQGLIIQLQMDLGKLWIILKGGGSLQVQTKSGVAAVLGSLMSVDYNSQTGDIRITCLEGHCALTTPASSVEITTGQAAEVTKPGQAPQVSPMTPQDYQDWLDNTPESSPYVAQATATPATTTLEVTPAPGINHKGGQGQGKGKGQSGH